MTREEFISLIGQDVVVDYPFFDEIQQWSMKNFYIDDEGKVHHKRLPLITDVLFLLPKIRIKVMLLMDKLEVLLYDKG